MKAKGNLQKSKPTKSKPTTLTTHQLSKQERKQIEQHVRKLTAKRKPSVQRTLPYIDIYPDGICQLSEQEYSSTIEWKNSATKLR